MAQFLTVSMENKFSFTCPIFDKPVQMRGCVLVRDKVFTGQNFEQRRGCQVCISAGKCPAAQIVQKIALSRGDATDHCSSVEEKHGRLPAEVLQSVRNVVVTDAMMAARGRLSESEADLIRSSGARIDAQLATAPRGEAGGRIKTLRASTDTPARSKAVSEPPRASVAPRKSSAVTKAAASGDLSAAISKENAA